MKGMQGITSKTRACWKNKSLLEKQESVGKTRVCWKNKSLLAICFNGFIPCIPFIPVKMFFGF
jgi:hypothetical protein